MGSFPQQFGRHGYFRVAAATPLLALADVQANHDALLAQWREAAEAGAGLVVFPELCLTGYTCADLFHNRALREAALEALHALARESAKLPGCAVVGLPLEVDQRLFNVAAVLAGGRVAGLIPKRHLPNYGEFYEQRWFTPAGECPVERCQLFGEWLPFTPACTFAAEEWPAFVLGVEICEDLWAPAPPSGELALAGALVLANPSASDDLLGKADYRRDLVRQQSARCLAGYVYAGAGPGESSTDLVYGGHSMVAENGLLVGESERFSFAGHITYGDLDLDYLAHERLRSTTFTRARAAGALERQRLALEPPRALKPGHLLRPLPAHPFVPGEPARRAERCREIFAIQTTGLARRLSHVGSKAAVIGISGGLDSTLALLVCVRALEKLGLPGAALAPVTMPGFGTSQQTLGNATRLIEALGLELRSIPIDAAVRQHFVDIGHDENEHTVVYENAQARERTQILMDLANQLGGLVVGTGDLSESALGWATYNADHMSMYHVNIGVPKTLVRYLVEWSADEVFEEPVRSILRDIAATPITPELLPLDEQGRVQQKTEETLGPYAVHDFFLYHFARRGAGPAKLLFLARQAFAGEHEPEALRRWLEVFLKRFFAQQFKRSCMPDGPKVGTVALSPRGDWRMPSDASPATWLRELEGEG